MLMIRCSNNGERREGRSSRNANHRHGWRYWQVYNHQIMIIWWKQSHWHWHCMGYCQVLIILYASDDQKITLITDTILTLIFVEYDLTLNIGRGPWGLRQCYGECLTGMSLSSSPTSTRPSRTQRLEICLTRLSSLSSIRCQSWT